MKSKVCLALACLVVSAFASVARADGFFDNTYTFGSGSDAAANAGKTINLGGAGRTHHYALFSTNGDISSTDTLNQIDVTGDVGANGNFSLSGSILDGDLYIKTGKTVSLGSKGTIKGTKHQNGTTDTMLNQGAADALALSNTIDSLVVQNNGAYADGSSINMTNTKFSITGGAGDTVVLKLQDFILTGGELDLFGSATTKFIINVRGNFSLSGGAKIVNAGALLASNVIFNYRGTGTASLGGGSKFNGILLAQNNTIQMTGGSVVNGQLIGKSLLLSGGSKVGPTQPPVVSP
jgi:hypothetical protein